jgi:thiol peroxidase
MTTQTMRERAGAVTFRGTPMTLAGEELKAGMPAPEFTLTTVALAPLGLAEAIDNGSRSAMLIVVPSLDTPVCSTEACTFNVRSPEVPKDMAAFVVSLDLPFAQARWSKAQNVDGIAMLSAYRSPEFGPAYGVLIKELGLLARAVFIISKNRTIAYAKTVAEVTSEPDYDEVFAAAQKLG